jgi:hypothetical protein
LAVCIKKIPDLYFYDVKYKPVLSKFNKNYAEKSPFFQKKYFVWARLGPKRNCAGISLKKIGPELAQR